MAQLFEESLFQAIKNDDTKAFNALMEKARCGSYRLGRFPVLSLLYLYKSRGILSVYEERFLKITAFEPLREPVEVSKKFSAKAGKCLRLYLNETVSPLEMLLILDKSRRLKRVYPLTKPSAAVKERLKAIYSIKYSLNVEFEGNGIILDRRPLSYREKKNIATICLCSVLAVTLAVGVPLTVNAVVPKPVEGEVTKLSQINFASKKEYTLKRDIILPDNFSVEKVNCSINGEGNKLVFGNGVSLGVINGKISDLTIESSGGALFTSVSETATIENVTVNVNADIETTEATALVAVTNYGTIDGVTLNVSGKINALATSTEDIAELTFGGLVQNNDYKYVASTQTVYRGVIKNCAVNYSQLALSGEASANAAFGGVAGINGGYLMDCTVSGKIIADTFDIAGVCVVNNGLLSENTNEADLLQTSSATGWNPIVCGIVLSNALMVENCVNKGKISTASDCAKSENEENEIIASAAGIAYLNRGSTANFYIAGCVNYGDVESVAENRNAYAAGICLSSSGLIESCKNTGSVTVKAANGYGTCGGGITALAYGDIYNSLNEGSVSAACDGVAYAGGISGRFCALFKNCLSDGDITVTAQSACAGGIFGFSEVIRSGLIFWGVADYCVSESKISVTVTGDKPAYVGGVGGCVSEVGFNDGESVTYFGGCVTNSYFTGECASENSNFGNIVGACGANIYKTNSYVSGGTQYNNFVGNFYIDNSYGAFGMTVAGDDEFDKVEDKGAETATIEDIKNSEGYKSVLSALGK